MFHYTYFYTLGIAICNFESEDNGGICNFVLDDPSRWSRNIPESPSAEGPGATGDNTLGK